MNGYTCTSVEMNGQLLLVTHLVVSNVLYGCSTTVMYPYSVHVQCTGAIQRSYTDTVYMYRYCNIPVQCTCRATVFRGFIQIGAIDCNRLLLHGYPWLSYIIRI